MVGDTGTWPCTKVHTRGCKLMPLHQGPAALQSMPTKPTDAWPASAVTFSHPHSVQAAEIVKVVCFFFNKNGSDSHVVERGVEDQGTENRQHTACFSKQFNRVFRRA